MSKSNDIQSNKRDQYMNCARVAQEFNQLVALAELAPLLEAEDDHAYLCAIGVWYWEIGHKQLAYVCYLRSIDIQPEAATYFNLAVCLDDIAAELSDGESINIRDRIEEYSAGAAKAMQSFYELVPTEEERSSAEAMLEQNGKVHLIMPTNTAP